VKASIEQVKQVSEAGIKEVKKITDDLADRLKSAEDAIISVTSSINSIWDSIDDINPF
jgi:flagellar hook-associated protein FlgK